MRGFIRFFQRSWKHYSQWISCHAEHVVKLMVERICATAAKVEAGSADRVREILLPRELN